MSKPGNVTRFIPDSHKYHHDKYESAYCRGVRAACEYFEQEGWLEKANDGYQLTDLVFNLKKQIAELEEKLQKHEKDKYNFLEDIKNVMKETNK